VAKSKALEMQMLLDQRSRARKVENLLMRQAKENIQNLKDQIDEASRLNELNIVEKVKDNEDFEIRKMNFLIQELKKDIEYYDDRRRFEEEEIDRMGNEKVIVQQDYIDAIQVTSIAYLFLILLFYLLC
jgi:cell division protein FtsB